MTTNANLTTLLHYIDKAKQNNQQTTHTGLTPMQHYLVRAFSYTDEEETYEIIDILILYFQLKEGQDPAICTKDKNIDKDVLDFVINAYYQKHKQA
jgi:hypothetical protein